MEMFAIGFAQVFNISSLCWIMAGVLLGIIFGCIPGLTGSIALALCLPLIYTLDIIQSMCLIMGIYRRLLRRAHLCHPYKRPRHAVQHRHLI